MFNDYIFLLLLRYGSLGSNNFHCSVPPGIIKKYNFGEFFGSPLNTISDVYYSPFDDIECHFGSKGNFFTTDIESGNYICNPPFDPPLINKTLTRVIDILDTVPNTTILCTLPQYSFTENKDLDVYKTDIDQFKKSKYTIEVHKLDKDEYKYYNYYTDSYIPVSDTEIILFSNCNPSSNGVNIGDIMKLWKQKYV